MTADDIDAFPKGWAARWKPASRKVICTSLCSYFPLPRSAEERFVTVIVPTAAGGANDAMARIIAQGLATRLGKPVIVDNKAGANGPSPASSSRSATPDGYTTCRLHRHARINPASETHTTRSPISESMKPKHYRLIYP